MLSNTEILRKKAQLRFMSQMARTGAPLTLTYGGRWQVDADGNVARAAVSPASMRIMGTSSLGRIDSAEMREREHKWGQNFVSDGVVIVPVADGKGNVVNASEVVSITNEATGAVYDVIMLLPDDYGSGVYHTFVVRDGLIYNRVVSVSQEDPHKDADAVIFANLPCRLFFASDQASGMGASDEYDFGSVEVGKPYLEYPPVYGVDGNAVLLDNKVSIVSDDPATRNEQGHIAQYRVASLNIDPGGEHHHMRYALTYMEL